MNSNENRFINSDDEVLAPPGSIVLRPRDRKEVTIDRIKRSLIDVSKSVVAYGRKKVWKRRERKIEQILYMLDDPAREISIKKQEQLMDSYQIAIDRMLPKYLYKYRFNKDSHIQNLTEDTIYLSKPNEFNDPKECMSIVDPRMIAIYALLRDEATIGAYSNVLDGKELSADDRKKIEKFAVLSEYGLSQLHKIEELVRIACLSEVIDSTLMWSHYSDNHSGFAIRYRMDEQEWDQCNRCKEKEGVLCRRPGKPVYPVIYRERRYDATNYALARASILEENNGLDNNDYPVPFLPVLQKDSCWDYEHEWRIACYNSAIKCMRMKADAIFLGANVNESLAKTLWRISKEKELKVFKMNVDSFSNSFALKYEDITDYSDELFNKLISSK